MSCFGERLALTQHRIHRPKMAPYKLAVTIYRCLQHHQALTYLARLLCAYCLCLKFPVVDLYDLPDIVNCLLHVFTAARL